MIQNINKIYNTYLLHIKNTFQYLRSRHRKRKDNASHKKMYDSVLGHRLIGTILWKSCELKTFRVTMFPRHKLAVTWKFVSPWRNWLARSAVNRKVGGSSPPGSADIFLMFYIIYIFFLYIYLVLLIINLQSFLDRINKSSDNSLIERIPQRKVSDDNLWNLLPKTYILPIQYRLL